jgi:O-antigen/teichoic acid export membrane protein
VPIVRVYTISFIIRALVGVQTTKLTKEMRFREQMFMQIPSTIVGGCVGVFLAYIGYGVWSLVWMNLIQSFLFTVQHWIFAGWLPNFVIDKSKLKYHFHFGYKLTISGLIDTVYDNIFKVVIGKYFAATELGYYTQAQTLQMLPVGNISTALGKVTYPMFAAVKDDNIRLKNAYRKLLHQVAFWVAPMMALAIVLAKPVFLVLLTAKWLPAVPYFQILCITGVLYPFHVYNLNILNVKGRSDLFLKLEIIKKIIITIGIIVAIPYGIYGLLVFRVFNSVIAFAINTYYSGNFIDYTGGKQIKEVLPILFISFCIGLFLWILKENFLIPYQISSVGQIFLLSFGFLVLYVAISRICKIEAMTDFKLLILKHDTGF